MWILLIVVLYIISFILSYILIKKDIIRDKSKWGEYNWTNGDRLSACSLSISGPVGVCLGIIFYTVDFLSKKYKNYLSKPSKW
jgi:hypothetical protein